MNFSNLGGMAASDCDDVMVVGPEAGNDFEDSIIAVSPFQKKRMNATTPEQVASAPKKTKSTNNGGRDISTLWSWFTEDYEPQKAKSATCKHCRVVVNHHKKSEIDCAYSYQ